VRQRVDARLRGARPGSGATVARRGPQSRHHPGAGGARFCLGGLRAAHDSRLDQFEQLGTVCAMSAQATIPVGVRSALPGSVCPPPQPPGAPSCAGYSTFRAFHHRNYRLFFSGQLVSLIGTWVQNAAIAWLAFELTGTSLWPALVLAAQF